MKASPNHCQVVEVIGELKGSEGGQEYVGQILQRAQQERAAVARREAQLKVCPRNFLSTLAFLTFTQYTANEMLCRRM